ncbi:MAG: hypothetical protein ACYDGR_17265 [Candidatus Dormibacteria bacterium]
MIRTLNRSTSIESQRPTVVPGAARRRGLEMQAFDAQRLETVMAALDGYVEARLAFEPDFDPWIEDLEAQVEYMGACN